MLSYLVKGLLQVICGPDYGKSSCHSLKDSFLKFLLDMISVFQNGNAESTLKCKKSLI